MKPSTSKRLNSRSRLKIRATDPTLQKSDPCPHLRGLFYYTNAVVRIYVQGTRRSIAAKKSATPPPHFFVAFLSVRWDRYAVQCKTREGRSAPAPALFAPRQPNREQTAPNDTTSGRLSQDAAQGLDLSSLAGTLSTSTNEPTLRTTMKTFLSVFAAYVAAGAFGVAFVQTALQSPLQQNSGTQQFVRVVR